MTKVKVAKPKFKKDQKLVLEMGLINGRSPGSIPEWFVANALWKMGLEFDYQLPFYGGHYLTGGKVLDFLVHTVPLYTPLEVFGEYWHEGDHATRDRAWLAHLSSIRQYNPPKVIWGKDCATQEMTNDRLAEIMRG